MIKIAAQVSVELRPTDIDVVHRLPTRKEKSTPDIIVAFASRKKRDMILTKRYDQVITNKDVLGSGFGPGRIFINESLSQYWKNLLWKAKIIKQQKNYKHCWYRNNAIHLKETDTGHKITIVNEQQLQQIP